MTRQEWMDAQKRECREHWFKNHVAQCAATGDIGGLHWENALVIRWQNPASWNYGCRFIIHRQWLIVVGDIGEAVYQWSEDISLGFMAGLDFGYFHGKCVASESGRAYVEWDIYVAETNCAARLAELRADEPSRHRDTEIELLEVLGRADRDDYKAAAQEYYDTTGDCDGAGNIVDMGEVPSGRAIGHFVGLQMAIQQLLQRSREPEFKQKETKGTEVVG
jgi:hypothetical protein